MAAPQNHNDELQSLSSIYMEDFSFIDESNNGCEIWVTPPFEPFFVSCALRFTFPPGYPETQCVGITMRRQEGLGDRLVSELMELLQMKAEAMKGEPAVFEIVEAAQEFLYRNNKPPRSEFMEDRQRNERKSGSEVMKEFQQRDALREEAERKQLSRKWEEERMRGPMTGRREHRDSIPNWASVPAPESSSLHFANCIGQGDAGNVVYAGFKDGHIVAIKIYQVKCKTSKVRYEDQKPLGLGRWMRTVNALKDEVDTLVDLSHTNLVRYFGLDVIAESDIITLHLIMEHVGGGSLRIKIQQFSPLTLEACRLYTTHILCGLEFLHNQNLVHGDLRPANVLLDAKGIAKLSEYVIGRKISNFAKSAGHASDHPPIMPTQHDDLIALGYIVLEMHIGTSELAKLPMNDTLPILPSSLNLHLFEFLNKCLVEIPASPLTISGMAHRLAKSSFLTAESLGDIATITPFAVSGGSDALHELISSTTIDLSKPSRYRTDFEELEHVGRGGFGAVVKVRNKLDKRIYAIKTIKLDPSKQAYTKKILREVTNLSRLNHPHVVRYYQAWIEGGQGQMMSALAGGSSFNEEDEEEFDEDEDEDDDGYNHDGYQHHATSFVARTTTANSSGESLERDIIKLNANSSLGQSFMRNKPATTATSAAALSSSTTTTATISTTTALSSSNLSKTPSVKTLINSPTKSSMNPTPIPTPTRSPSKQSSQKFAPGLIFARKEHNHNRKSSSESDSDSDSEEDLDDLASDESWSDDDDDDDDDDEEEEEEDEDNDSKGSIEFDIDADKTPKAEQLKRPSRSKLSTSVSSAGTLRTDEGDDILFAEEEAIPEAILETGSGNTKADPLFSKSSLDAIISNVSNGAQYLYIQMEHCEKKTLRDLIISGLSRDPVKVQVLFRQIVEGLAHIHQQAMIHRDLKPENLFLDADENIKIGDFGLSTSQSDEPFISGAATPDFGNNSHVSSYENVTRITSCHSVDESLRTPNMTGNIGTTFYLAPELSHNAARAHYDEKVDLYSLGIILFEMCHPFASMHERAIVLTELRKPQVNLPAEFNLSVFREEARIIQHLLAHNPKSRPSISELLRSLPAKVEDRYVREMLNALSNRETSAHVTLMQTLFGQTSRMTHEYTYDGLDVDVAPVPDLAMRTSVKDRVAAVFVKHGAVQMSVPLLVPVSERSMALENTVKLLDTSGNIVQLPLSLQQSFARYVSRKRIESLKRFTFEPVFRERFSFQPVEDAFCAFDIVTSTSILGHVSPSIVTAEVVKVLTEVFGTIIPQRKLSVKLGHVRLVRNLLEAVGLTESQISSVLKVLRSSRNKDGKKRWTYVRSKLIQEKIFSESDLNSIEETLRYDAMQKKQPKSSPSGASIHEIELTLLSLQNFGVNCEVSVDLSQMPQLPHLNAIFFHVISDQNDGTSALLAAGGRYDELVETLSPPNAPHHVIVCGFELAFDRLVKMAMESPQYAYTRESTVPIIETLQYPVSEVCVSTSNAAEYQPSLVSFLSSLWDAGIGAEAFFNCSLSMDEIVRLCRRGGSKWIVLFKEGARKVKLKSIDGNVEEELDIGNVPKRIRSNCEEKQSEITTVSTVSTVSTTSQSASLVLPKDPAIRITAFVAVESDKAGSRGSAKKEARKDSKKKLEQHAIGKIQQFMELTGMRVSVDAVAVSMPQAYLSEYVEVSDFNSSELSLSDVPQTERKTLQKVHDHCFATFRHHRGTLYFVNELSSTILVKRY